MKEYDAYRAVYCGLCRQLGRSFGALARATLSYDFTFLSMVAATAGGSEPAVERRRCCVNPLRQVPMCACPTEDAGDTQMFSADIAALMLYYKLVDNIRDTGGIRRLGWLLLRPWAARARRKAAAARPEADAAIALAMERQRQVEERGSDSLDEACEPSSAAMAAILAGLGRNEAQRRVLERVGYLVGRYVYLCDALDDAEEDRKSGNYNPFVIRYGADDALLREEGRRCLNLTTAELEHTLDLLEPAYFTPILANIGGLGLQAGVDQILSQKEQLP